MDRNIAIDVHGIKKCIFISMEGLHKVSHEPRSYDGCVRLRISCLHSRSRLGHVDLFQPRSPLSHFRTNFGKTFDIDMLILASEFVNVAMQTWSRGQLSYHTKISNISSRQSCMLDYIVSSSSMGRNSAMIKVAAPIRHQRSARCNDCVQASFWWDTSFVTTYHKAASSIPWILFVVRLLGVTVHIHVWHITYRAFLKIAGWRNIPIPCAPSHLFALKFFNFMRNIQPFGTSAPGSSPRWGPSNLPNGLHFPDSAARCRGSRKETTSPAYCQFVEYLR